MDYEIEKLENAANGINTEPLNLGSITEDDVVKHKDLTWLFRLARIFTFSAHKTPDEIESIFEKAQTPTEIYEISGIYRTYTFKKQLKMNLNTPTFSILFIDGFANAGKFTLEVYESLFYSLASSLPSSIMHFIRALRCISPTVQSDVFQKAFLSLFPKIKENRSYIVLLEYKTFLLQILGTSSHPKVFKDYIHPMTKDLYNSMPPSATKDILNDIFPPQKIKSLTDDYAFKISEYFKKGSPKPDFDTTSGIVMAFKPIGAAYFIFGQIDTLNYNFFDLYIILYKILNIMKRKSNNKESESNYEHFIEVEAPKIISNIVHKGRKLAISYLIKGDLESVIQGAKIASSQNAA